MDVPKQNQRLYYIKQFYGFVCGLPLSEVTSYRMKGWSIKDEEGGGRSLIWGTISALPSAEVGESVAFDFSWNVLFLVLLFIFLADARFVIAYGLKNLHVNKVEPNFIVIIIICGGSSSSRSSSRISGGSCFKYSVFWESKPFG
jgi:hypothetical protein